MTIPPTLPWTASPTGAALLAALLVAGCGDGGGPVSPAPVTPPSSPPSPGPPTAPGDDRFVYWNSLPPESWWRDSEPYSCYEEENPNSPWVAAGLPDLGGSDPLSLIRFFGNGRYARYGFMGFVGCTRMIKFPKRTRLDTPVDPTYYSRGDLEILVDLARVPPDADGWFEDDGNRVDFRLERAVDLLNTHVAAYYRRISENQLRITFRAGEEFEAPEDGSPTAVNQYHYELFGACQGGSCEHGAPGGMDRILLNDVAAARGGNAWNGWVFLGLASFAARDMGTIVHEIGHAWMFWAHSYWEVPWKIRAEGELETPNPYKNRYDIMSDSGDYGVWDAGMPSTLAINRYAAGWIRPEEVALHLEERATYTLARPRRRGHQFLVVNSGRRGAFTTLEVLDDFPPAYRTPELIIYESEFDYRPPRYEGVFVARYDQTSGTGVQARVGPALHNRDNPNFLWEVGWGRDDHSLIPDGGERDIGGGVRVTVSRNRDGSYQVTVAGGPTAPFEPWCLPIRVESEYVYDTGCFLDTAVWE